MNNVAYTYVVAGTIAIVVLTTGAIVISKLRKKNNKPATLNYKIENSKRLDEQKETKRQLELQKKRTEELKNEISKGEISKGNLKVSYYFLSAQQCYDYWVKESEEVMKTLNEKRLKAFKRLMTEFKEIVTLPEQGIGLLPENEKNFFCWHANVKPLRGQATNGVFHYTIRIPDNYPDVGPTITPHHSFTAPYFYWTPKESLLNMLRTYQAHLVGATLPIGTSTLAMKIPEVHHNPPNEIWPPFKEVKTGLLAQLVAPEEESYETKMKKTLVCSYSRRTFEDDALGVDIRFTKNIRTGDITSIHSQYELFALKAVLQYGVKNVGGQAFTHWLPIYINPQHGKKATELARRALSMISTGTTKKYTKEQVLDVLPKLMNTIPVDLTQGKLTYIKALQGYCFIHRLMILFAEEHPEIIKQADDIIAQFLEDGAFRHKDKTPNLGIILCLLSISDKYSWKDVRVVYLKEALARQVYWNFQKYKELDPDYIKKQREQREKEKKPADDIVDISDEKRVHLSFEAAKQSLQILMIHAFLLRNVSRPAGVSRKDIAKQYDDYYGLPIDQVQKAWADEYTYICGHSFKSFNSLFAAMDMETKDDNEVAKMLLQAIEESKRNGYHGKVLAAISAEEYIKQNKVDLKQFGTTQGSTFTFDKDERKWQLLCFERFGVESLPDYMVGQTDPWRRHYLQLHLQECIEYLNDSKDFEHLYTTAELVKNDIAYIDIALFDPSNLGSKYFFLTKVITMLTSLKTLVISKGTEKGINDKSFIAICKGLNNNKTIEELIIEYAGLNRFAIEKLLKNNLLANINLKRIKFGGNMLLDDGVQTLAKFLQSHETLNSLTELDLSDNRISDTGAKALGEALLYKNNLKILKLQHNNWRNCSELLDKLSYSPTITDIDLSRSEKGSVTDASLAKLFRNTNSVKSLNLWKTGNAAFGPSMVEALGTNETLTCLDIADCKINNYHFEHIGKALSKNTTLTELRLDQNQINSQGILKILESQTITKKIKKSEQEKGKEPATSSTTIFEEDDESSLFPHNSSNAKQIVTLIVKPAFSWKVLGLSYNRIDQDNHDVQQPVGKKKKNKIITEKATPEEDERNEAKRKEQACLGELISCSKQLEVLKLKSCNLGPQFMTGISDALSKEGCILQELNLRQNHLGKPGLKNLADGLMKTAHLQFLDISGNKLGSAGALVLAKIMEKNVSIKKLILYGNFIEADGMCALVQALQKNPDSKLEELDIGLNRIRNRGAIALLDWMEGRPAEGKSALLEERSASSSSAQVAKFPLKKLHMKDNHIASNIAIQIAYAISNHIKKEQGSKATQDVFTFISMGGNFISNEIKSELAKIFTQVAVQFDLAKIVEFKDEEKQSRTIYIPKLHISITDVQLKKHFKKGGCGQVLSVDIHNYKKKSKSLTSEAQRQQLVKYAFVEFADPMSVQLAMQMVFQKRAKINKHEFKIYRAGITQQQKK